MKTNHKKCLLLNVDYTPITVISWKRAIVWYFKYEQNNNYGIDILDFYKNDHILGVSNKKFPIPAITKTKRYFHVHNEKVIFSRKNIFIRDDYTCQYCNKKFDYKELTYDHVIPKSSWVSKSTSTCWTNIVTACFSCNNKKGNRTPKEANMPLNKPPVKPERRLRYLPIYDYLSTINEIPEEWSVYLPEY
jgi:hypothetical protein